MSTMLVYLDKVSTDDLEIVRFVVFWLFIIANAGVVAGVVLEREKNSHATKENGWRLLVISLGAEIFFSTVAFGIDLEIGRQQKAEIGRQNAEIIALRNNSIPRSINVSAFAERLAGAPPAKLEIRYVRQCADCESLSFWLSEALKKARWPVDPPIPIDPQNGDWVRIVQSLHAQSSGVTVVFDSPDKITADPKSSIGALMGALMHSLGFNFSGYDVNTRGGVDSTMPSELIRIVIAPKA